MSMIPMFLKEMEHEAIVTRKMLAIVPNDKLDWKPHPKSMSIRALATHISELPSWVSLALNTDELDFSKGDYKPTILNSNMEMLDTLEKGLKEAKADLEKAKETDMDKKWVMRSGDVIHAEMTKAETIRHAFCQTVHHRAQLGVFLRLLDIPIPGTYGPSADDQSM